MTHEKKDYNILVIEDNPGDFALVEEFLISEMDGTPLIVNAADFKSANEILMAKNCEFDVILLDLSLPDKNGEPLIHSIIEGCQNAPVIVLTGYADFKFGIKSLSLGVSDYMLKDELTSVSLHKSIIYCSERKKIISALEESEKKYSELFHLSPLPMFVVELGSWQFLDVNNAAVKSYGYSREEFLQMDLRGIKLPEEVPLLNESPFRDAMAKKEYKSLTAHRKKNGDVIQVDIQSNLLEYKGKKARVTIASDITERLKYIAAIETQNEKLREVSWIQSHVVRAPLTRIMGLIPLLKDFQENSDDFGKMLDYMISSANELDAIIKGITEKLDIADDDSPGKPRYN